MVNAPLKSIRHECLLWEIDADELWTAEQVTNARHLFLQDGSLTSAFYWCHFFVGRGLAVSTRNCYSQNPGMEWLRTWRYYPNCHWVAHEPPRLASLQPNGQWADQGVIKPLMHTETEKAGLVFHHYAYTTPSQLRFKEVYYGYRGAVTGWNRLQANPQFPCALKSFLPWVHDRTQADQIDHLGISVLPDVEQLFTTNDAASETKSDIVVDAVFFQYYNTGIARVWRSLLAEWAGTDFGKRLLILDRAGKAPRVPGLRYLEFPAHDYANLGLDQQRIQQVCDSKGAQLFISTYYTTPVTMPSVLLVHDMIPELFGADLNHPMWVEKVRAINEASAFVCVSQNTANDLLKFHPDLPKDKIVVAHNGVGFQQPSAAQVAAFKSTHQISKPYFLISGGRSSYKNTIQFFKAFAQLGDKRAGYSIVCTGPREQLPAEIMALVGDATVHLLDLTDDELTCAYAGAIALVYTSLYEGFGMPLIEAMACGCPVITCPSGPLPEVGGEAVLYVAAHDIEATLTALHKVQEEETRAALIAKGLERARLFSWKAMADRMAAVMSSFLQPT
jgi:glycosyltransferase involved in cell wall biosynthesis